MEKYILELRELFNHIFGYRGSARLPRFIFLDGTMPSYVKSTGISDRMDLQPLVPELDPEPGNVRLLTSVFTVCVTVISVITQKQEFRPP